MIQINLLTRRLRSLPFWRRRTQLRSGASATQRQQPGPRPGLRTVYLLASGHCTAHSHLCSHWALCGPLGRLTLVHVGPECVWGNNSFYCNSKSFTLRTDSPEWSFRCFGSNSFLFEAVCEASPVRFAMRLQPSPMKR